MRHLQKMSPRKRTEFIAMQYKRMLEERRGHNFTYLTQAVHEELERKGYEQLMGPLVPAEIHSESTALGWVYELRRNGHYARVFCIANRLRIKQYTVFFKKKEKKDAGTKV
jgi:hypothetical protein